MGARAWLRPRLLTASTALADLESVLKAATKFEDGWAIKLDRALKAEGADVNLLVEDPNNAGNMVTPLLVVLKAIAERKGGFAIFTNLLGHKDIDLNGAGKAPNGEKMTPILTPSFLQCTPIRATATKILASISTIAYTRPARCSLVRRSI